MERPSPNSFSSKCEAARSAARMQMAGLCQHSCAAGAAQSNKTGSVTCILPPSASASRSCVVASRAVSVAFSRLACFTAATAAARPAYSSHIRGEKVRILPAERGQRDVAVEPQYSQNLRCRSGMRRMWDTMGVILFVMTKYPANCIPYAARLPLPLQGHERNSGHRGVIKTETI